MSKIGNNKNFGKNLNVVMTHHGGEDILNNENLYPNSLIISAANNGEGLDLNSYALLATDSEGTPVRLTYTLREGNGLVTNAANSNYDIMSLEIDKDSILSSYKGYGLEVGKTNIIDNYTLAVYQDPDAPKTRIKVVTANLDKATDVAYGIVIGDNYTISANNGVLTVNTQNLDYVDDNLNVSGIVRFNPDPIGDEYDWRTVEANNGVLHVITYNLDRATEDQVGVIKPDMVTTNVEQPSGTLSVITAGLDYATESTYGTVRPDNSTIQVNEGVIEAHAENMTCTTTTSYGVVKLDEVSLGVDYAGYTYVQRYYDILAILNRYMEDYDYIISRLIDHENRIAALENAAAAEYIYSFNNYGTRTTVLTEPYWDNINHVVVSDYELHTVVFSINTNCPFNVSFEFEDQSNVTPQITLQNVRLGNGAPIDASALQSHTFASTNSNESTLSFTFRCNNYTSSTDENYTLTNVTLKVSSINDSSIYKIGSHIFKRWNEAKYVENVPESVYSTSTQVTKQYTYYGPYFDYWTGGEYTHALDTSLTLASDPETTTEEINDAVSTLISRRTELSTARNTAIPGAASQVNKQNQNGTLIEYGYNDNLGEYAWIGAYSGSRTSYSFMFSTVKIVEEKTTKSISYLKDGQLSTELPTDWGTSDNPKIETSSSYYVSYMSSPVGTQIGRVNLNMTSDKAIRDMNYTGINDNWNSATEIPNWLSYSITTVASNTGYYNILNVSSTASLSDKDRKATIKLTGNYTTSDTIWSENRSLVSTPIANIGEQLNLSNELKFTLIEDVYEEQPNANVIVQCMNNASNPLQITVTRTPSATVIGESWGVVLKFYYTKSGIDATEKYGIKKSFANTVTYRTSTSSFTSTTNTSRISTNDINKETVQVEGETVNPIVLIIKVDKSKTSEVWNAADSNIVPQSVYDILDNPEASNDISSISIISCTAFGFNYGETYDDINDADGVHKYFDTQNQAIRFNENKDMQTTYSVYGTWPTASIEPANEITFGNATVTAITINPWNNNDNELSVEITLRPGNLTSIPDDNHTIIPEQSAKALIYVDNVVYSCDSIQIENSVWTTTGCLLNMRIAGIHADNDNPEFVAQGNLTPQTIKTGLNYITAIKLYFKVSAANTPSSICTMNYATALNGVLTDKIMLNAQYNVGLSKQVSIPNALYNPNPGIIINEKEETENTVTQMAEMLEKLQNEIENLKVEQQSSQSQYEKENESSSGNKTNNNNSNTIFSIK